MNFMHGFVNELIGKEKGHENLDSLTRDESKANLIMSLSLMVLESCLF